MMGLALMALRLAEQRAVAKFPEQNLEGFCRMGMTPAHRSEVEADPNCSDLWPLSSEYYRIIDRIARGEKPVMHDVLSPTDSPVTLAVDSPHGDARGVAPAPVCFEPDAGAVLEGEDAYEHFAARFLTDREDY